MTDTMVVTQPQPVIYVQGSDGWSSGLFDFCENVPECKCLFAYFCLPCFACKTSRDYGENLCLPLADWVSGMIPPATMSMRVSMRHRYGITGTMCNDCVLSTFCMSCVWCQMSREMKKRALPVVMVATKNV
uniref:Cornifelin homolog B-like n=1 Tax=Pundamilia nyererei TaxID=303518 RepID=A0A3B4G6J3_9CICH